jgi:hypothetical protein
MGCILDPDWTPEIEEGVTFEKKDSCGNICIRNTVCDKTTGWNLEFKIKDPDKEFLSLIEGNPLVVNGEGVSIGVRQLAYGACNPWLFLELFERTDDCNTAGDPIYLRHVFPAVRLKWVGNEREGIFRILQIEGSTQDVLTDSIGEGPYFDIPVGIITGSTASERIDYVWFEDTVLPEVECGSMYVPCEPNMRAICSGDDDECQTFMIADNQLSLANHMQIFGSFGSIHYYDPAGPDAGSNPGTATILSWTNNLIRIMDTQFGNETLTHLHFWGVGDSPDYGLYAFTPHVNVTDCP